MGWGLGSHLPGIGRIHFFPDGVPHSQGSSWVFPRRTEPWVRIPTFCDLFLDGSPDRSDAQKLYLLARRKISWP